MKVQSGKEMMQYFLELQKITIRFDKDVRNICLKTNRKLITLTRVARFLLIKKIRILFKAFIESQFKYSPLVWMFHERQVNDKINILHEKALRIVQNDTVTSFKNLLIKDKSVTIYLQSIQLLAIEIHKTIHNLPGGDLSEFFVKNNHNYNLPSESEMLLLNGNTVVKGQNSISYFGLVIWNSISFELRKTSSY